MDYVQLEKDVKILYQSVDVCNEHIDRTNIKIDTMNLKMDSMLNMLQGNPLNEHDIGLIGIVMETKKKAEKLEQLKNKFIWLIIGMSIAAGYGLRDLLTKYI